MVLEAAGSGVDIHKPAGGLKEGEMAHEARRISWRRALVPLGLLAIGLILTTVQLLLNAGSYVSSWFVHVEHPVTYRFTTYGELLKAHVNGDFVDYAGLVKEAAFLNHAVKELEHVSPDRLSGDDEQVCFWVNTYNMLALKNIVDHYPVRSLEQLAQTFSLRDFVIGGKTYSAGQIEVQRLLPLIKKNDARILFTVCGGAQGYPPLLNHALQPPSLIDDATAACAHFVNSPKNVYLDPDTNTFYLSPFFRWNAGILSKDLGSPFDFANQFLTPDKKVNLADFHVKRRYLTEFNWLINDIALAPGEAEPTNNGREHEGKDATSNTPPAGK